MVTRPSTPVTRPVVPATLARTGAGSLAATGLPATVPVAAALLLLLGAGLLRRRTSRTPGP